MMSVEQTEQLMRWTDAITQLSKQITAAEIEYDAAATIRLERKHKLEELRSQLRQLCDEGAFGESSRPNLFSNAPEQPNQDGIRNLAVPARIISVLEKANVTTLTRLTRIIDGLDLDYSDIENIPGLDTDAINRILGAINDKEDDDEDDSPRIVPYEAPLTSSAVAAAPKNTEGAMKIRVLIDDEESGLVKGQVVSAVVPDTGEAILTLGDEQVMLESNEFELVS